MNLKEKIAIEIVNALKEMNCQLDIESISELIEVPKEKQNGDFSFPCFRLAKELRKSPIDIANELKEKINIEFISKIEVLNGFLNFYVLRKKIVEETVRKFKEQDKDYGKSDLGKGKTVLVEYSSPNIAKPFHIGHLKTTIIGNSLYKIYNTLGFNTIRLNHLGDYGTQFAKLIEAYKRWGSEYDFSENAIDKLADLYVRINVLCNEDESVLEECRNTFKKLEDGDPFCVELRNKFKDLSLKEFDKIYNLLNIEFDSINGESFYLDKIDEIIDILEKSGKLEISNGAKIIDLSSEGINTPCIIKKSDGTSIYATRDLAAILYRTRTYDFDKCLYVVGEEQTLHLKQVFAVAKYLGIDEKYYNGLQHVSYGMIRLPEGKMSSRKGNFVKVEDLLNESIAKSQEIIQTRDIEDKEKVSKQVGIGAVIFDNLKESRTKMQVFDLNAALNFNGETGPYVQYTTVRTASVLEKAEKIPTIDNINFEVLTDDASIEVIKLIASFTDSIIQAMRKNEPSIIARYLLTLAKAYSVFYSQNKVICDDEKIQNARVYLTYMTKITLTNGLDLLGIEVPNKM